MKEQVRLGGIGRLLSGESIFKSTWKNGGSSPGWIALTPNMPASIIPLDLDRTGGEFKCKRDAFMASANPDVKLTVSVLNSASCLACCCSGMDVFMQDVRGKGMVRHSIFLSSIQLNATIFSGLVLSRFSFRPMEQ
jgi:uncharacterized protein (AIM24 family)